VKEREGRHRATCSEHTGASGQTLTSAPASEQGGAAAVTAVDAKANISKANDDTSDRLTTRSVRSFVIRNGRLTKAQGDALDRLAPKYCLPYQDNIVDTRETFGRQAPLWLEIGFGNGDALLYMAKAYPDADLIGCEVHAPGVGHALIGIEQRGLENVRIVQHDAMEVLEHMLAPASVQRVLLFFPDPWHKKRHHKRRIVQRDFLDACARVMVPDGLLHCATDWADYADWMQEHIEADERFENVAGPGQKSPRPDWRTLTRFEVRGTRLGHEVTDLLYTRRRD